MDGPGKGGGFRGLVEAREMTGCGGGGGLGGEGEGGEGCKGTWRWWAGGGLGAV